ncbi:hypothetical protein KP509_32G005900 [Ceratopteris richardii]|uniref:Uncharacterized protein n=1 Tax=Ceratopteris richardii TaxID=49495 RepID=A0A8T2QST5_CERRI|nr:hypothetical protein KP509_32G005900 [Ceratopteris richardii]
MIIIKGWPSPQRGAVQNPDDRKADQRRKKGFPITRACKALIAHSLHLRRCKRLFPSIWPAAGMYHTIRCRISLDNASTKKAGRQAFTATSSHPSSCPPELIADCIEYLKRSSAMEPSSRSDSHSSSVSCRTVDTALSED